MRQRPRPAVLVLLACLVLLGPGCGRNRGLLDLERDRAIDEGPPVPYRVEVAGDLPRELRTLLPEASRAHQLEAEPPSSELVVRRRALDDVPRLEAALRSEGYYEGRVEMALTPAEGSGRQARPVRVTFNVTPGPLYRLARREVELSGERGGFAPPLPNALGLREGAPARARAVLDAEQALLKQARKQGHPLARLGQRATVVDSDHHSMDVTLRLEPGPKARFGPVTVTGADGLSADFLRRRLPFKPGDPYDPDKVEQGRHNLYDTNLLSTLVIDEGKQLTPDGRLPITLQVTPRAARSVGVSLGYQTDTGPSGTLFWEHRNLLGGGERLRAEADVQQPTQRLDLNFRKPDFLSTSQSLIADEELKRERTEAYDSLSASSALGVERPLAPGVTGRLGIAYRYVELRDRDKPEEVYGLVSLPGGLDWDFSDNLLNPTRGGRLSLSAAPYVDTLSADRRFFKTRLTTSRYLPLSAKPNLVLALRGSVGSAFGVSRDDIPADERFYAGGGGSVRGIPFQLAGPLDDDDKPLGGRSLLEIGTELRYRITDSLGAVLFVDGGSVFDGAYPDLSEPLRWGAGPGLRYYTPIGPLRLDVGFPLDRRGGVDDLFQLYLSIGQAF